MLITRCPHCETAFHIQAAHLEQAEGHVRCGRCASVFDAYLELRQSLSPTLTDLAEASLDPQAVEDDGDSTFSSAEVDELERALHTEETDPKVADSATANAPTVTEEEPDEQTGASATNPAPGAEPGRLEFNLPEEQWQDFFSDTVVGEGEVPAISDTGVEWVVLGEVDFDKDASKDIEQTQQDLDEGERAAASAVADSDGQPAKPSEITAAVETTETEETEEPEEPEETAGSEEVEELPDGHVMDLTHVAEQSQDSLDDPASLATDLFRDLEEGPSEAPPAAPKYGLAAAALLLLLALGGQYLHYNRHKLATNAAFGTWVIQAYDSLGLQINPSWDLDQYQINRWVAASDSSDADNPSLKITAQISNRGPSAQPYPLVQLALKDRWDETVAGRVFEPTEYLSDGVARGLLGAGDHIQAELKVLDPGQDAYGFELDVCIRAENQRLQCANEP